MDPKFFEPFPLRGGVYYVPSLGTWTLWLPDWYTLVEVTLGQFPGSDFKKLETFISYLLGHLLLQLSHHAMRKPYQSVESTPGDKLRFLALSFQLAGHVSESSQKWTLWHSLKLTQLMPHEQRQALSAEPCPNCKTAIQDRCGFEHLVLEWFLHSNSN